MDTGVALDKLGALAAGADIVRNELVAPDGKLDHWPLGAPAAP